MDVLGYKCMIRRAEQDNRSQALLEDLYEPLKTARESLEDTNLVVDDHTPKDRFVLRAFTDNIVMGWPLPTSTRTAAGSALRQALEKVSLFQLDMASRGFFFRGAISVGDVFIDGIAVFGPALLDAYCGESKHADFPRVILTTSAVEAECEYRANYPKSESYPLSRHVHVDSDNWHFVNYLNSGFLDGVLISRHRDVLVAKLKEFEKDIKIERKYRWVAEYHNAFCAEHPEEFRQWNVPLLPIKGA